MDTVAVLKELSEAPGPSSQEKTIREILKKHWAPLVDEVRTDALGNLIALQHGNGPEPRPTLMAAAHMDEIGLIVTGIEREFLRVHALGGADRRTLPGLEVTVHGRRPLPGIIGTRPPHVLPRDARNKVLLWQEIFVDVGLLESEVQKLVRVGDLITFQRPMLTLKHNLVAGKAMDNRASVAALTLTLQALRTREHDWDFYAIATVQEETGLIGAITSAYGIAPQMAIALDVTFAKQHDDSGDGAFELDKGPTISIGPNFHPTIVNRLRKIAKDKEIPFTMEPVTGHSGTDAWGIQVAREGIPTGLIGIPVRYMHQPVETVSTRDIERAGRLLTSFVAGLNVDFRPHWEDENIESERGTKDE